MVELSPRSAPRVSRRVLIDRGDPFDVSILEGKDPRRLILFCVGAGGDPGRHLALLTALASRGCTVAAPHFQRLTPPAVTEGDLSLRGRRLRLALDDLARPDIPVAGVGHSIGASMLLALAGAQLWTRAGRRVALEGAQRLDRLALLTPATDFFRVPGALEGVRIPILAWAGTKDEITPAPQAEFLRDAIGARASVVIRLVEGAGHFSFMDTPPPGMTEPLPDRDTFLAGLAGQVCDFVTG